MTRPPACAGLGAQCQNLDVTLRIGTLDEGAASVDHEATWLLGHTERISFGSLRRQGLELLVDAVLHVRCRHLKAGPNGAGAARCAVYGFQGAAPLRSNGKNPARRLPDEQFRIVDQHQAIVQRLEFPPRSLPVLGSVPDEDAVNPCSIAPCATADHKRGSACCRDLQVEIMCRKEETELEALIRSRQSPYLCKVSREADDAIEAEMISACGYLDDEGANCTLHGRLRPDGRPAKPDLCSEWPADGKGLHPGCIFWVPPKPRKPKQRQQ